MYPYPHTLNTVEIEFGFQAGLLAVALSILLATWFFSAVRQLHGTHFSMPVSNCSAQLVCGGSIRSLVDVVHASRFQQPLFKNGLIMRLDTLEFDARA